MFANVKMENYLFQVGGSHFEINKRSSLDLSRSKLCSVVVFQHRYFKAYLSPGPGGQTADHAQPDGQRGGAGQLLGRVCLTGGRQ